MARTAIVTKLVLLLTLALALAASMATTQVDAQRILKAADVASERALVSEEAQPEQIATRALSEANANSSSSNASAESATASTTTSEKSSGSSKTETHAEGPTLSSFTGPMLAGAVAILLIGFVIAFKNRKTSS
ncbi:hypothetical protein Gpo141_00009728 [Globisporangium polare]